jgi:NADPH-dependent 2,4-dienoyl-CoA reductase/sulfur reductase-like enzyme
LSKGLLNGSQTPESVAIVSPQFFSDAKIEFHEGVRVEAINAPGRQVTLTDGRVFRYGKLLLCTGGRVRVLPCAPQGQKGIFYLRTIDDAFALRRTLTENARAVVVGGGFLGLEVAATARKLGVQVTVVEAAPNLLERAMAPPIAKAVEDIHRQNDVDFRLNTTVIGIRADGNTNIVALSDGSELPAEAVIVAIGIVPNVELAAQAGAVVENGIVVDEFGRASLPDIFAAGDVANHPNALLGRRLRLESWQNAQNQAIAVARGLCGDAKPYVELPWFWSDQYGFNIQMVGLANTDDQIVLRERAKGQSFAFLTLEDDLLTAAVTFNMGGEVPLLRKLIQSKAKVPAGLLSDPGVRLRDILARGP